MFIKSKSKNHMETYQEINRKRSLYSRIVDWLTVGIVVQILIVVSVVIYNNADVKFNPFTTPLVLLMASAILMAMAAWHFDAKRRMYTYLYYCLVDVV